MNLIKSKIESLLFISGSPLSIQKIAKLLNCKNEEIVLALEELRNQFVKDNRGLDIVEVNDKYQLVTAKENSKEVQEFLRQEVVGELTRPQLETLTIIAYRGPIIKLELEQIRGVNCTLILRNLMIRGLIENGELKEGMDTYIATHEFLKYLGITKVSQLPDYEKLNSNKNLKDLLARSEDNAQKEN